MPGSKWLAPRCPSRESLTALALRPMSLRALQRIAGAPIAGGATDGARVVVRGVRRLQAAEKTTEIPFTTDSSTHNISTGNAL